MTSCRRTPECGTCSTAKCRLRHNIRRFLSERLARKEFGNRTPFLGTTLRSLAGHHTFFECVEDLLGSHLSKAVPAGRSRFSTHLMTRSTMRVVKSGAVLGPEPARRRHDAPGNNTQT